MEIFNYLLRFNIYKFSNALSLSAIILLYFSNSSLSINMFSSLPLLLVSISIKLISLSLEKISSNNFLTLDICSLVNCFSLIISIFRE